MTAGLAIGPYRGHASPSVALRPPGVPSPRSLDESWIGDGVTLKLGGELTAPKTTVLHVAMAVVTFGPVLGVGIGLLFGAEAIALVPAVIIGGFFGWVWHRAIRGHRAALLVNTGRLDEAERLIGTKAFGMELTIGLLAQMRGDHERAAAAYRKTVAVFETRGGRHMQAVHVQAYAREAIALTNLGRLDEAHRRLQAAPAAGPYVDALVLVATAYLAFAANQTLPRDMVQRLEQTFYPVRGAWGALGLAAYSRDRGGDPAGCQALLDEESRRIHAPQLAAFMPLLARWADQRRVHRA